MGVNWKWAKGHIMCLTYPNHQYLKGPKRTLQRFTFILLLFILLSSISGCAVNRAAARVTPGTDLGIVKTYYVVQRQDDERSIDKLIRDNLIKRGLSATAGPEMPQQSYKADVIVTYVDRWMWDITMYMLELAITFRNPTNNYPMAVGNSLHTSLTRKSPEEMADEVLTNIFTNPQKGSKGGLQ